MRDRDQPVAAPDSEAIRLRDRIKRADDVLREKRKREY